ncbi:sensor histidine kinase [Alkalicoccus daliensis]|uniref:histidine kinase n=1 Tax=Alkalicoccus daliensis TaxID=745820 RepID=A0A1G9Z8U6_9BACI|nr:HAMP domain-containing sensor histidine kinase [Alkalicoccus daliensis]SDN17779.1 HAMP domain-containing protein [Alkalicoccus daliensis]
MKLSLKAAALVFAAFLLLISVLSAGFYFLSYNFYQEQLLTDIDRRMDAHREVVEEDFHPEVFNHVRVMEERAEEVNYILFDGEGNAVEETAGISDEEREIYNGWLASQLPLADSSMEFVDTSHHTIAHVFAAHPVIIDGTVEAYLFVDQATTRFEATRASLLWLTIGTSGISLLLAGMLAWFFSRFMTRSLVKLTKATEQVARENFDAAVYTPRQDEIGELSRSVHIMTNQLKFYRDSRRKFLSDVSHDLRTPLTYVKAYAALLKDQPAMPPDQLSKQAGVIHGEALRMERLVEDLFQLTKMDEGHWELELEEEDLTDLLTDARPNFEMMAQQENRQLHMKLAGVPSIVHVDSERMIQALTNIVRNALHHTPEGKTVSIYLSREQGEAVISVEDEGPGIPEDELPLIWERFYRADKSRTSSAGGSGLGLPITKQIVEAHHGKVAAVNKESGAVFIIRLPLVRKNS